MSEGSHRTVAQCKKRKNLECEANAGNAKKKRKLNNEDQHPDISQDFQNFPADKALEFDKFVESLPSTTNKHKIKELYFRKHAVNEFLARHKRLWLSEFDEDQFFNDKMHALLNETVMAIRNRKARDWSDQEVWANDGDNDLWRDHNYTRFSIEIALKTTNYKLFDCGYIWYRFHYDVGREEKDEDEDWMHLLHCNEAIMYKGCYDTNDCFNDNTYYCETGIVAGRAVTFDSLRKDLCLQSLNAMNDAEVACFITAICLTAFYNGDNMEADHDFSNNTEELMDWIKKRHVSIKDDRGFDKPFNETDIKFETCETVNTFWRY